MPGLLPSEFDEVAPYPELQRLLSVHINMQFEDLRAVLRLPLKAVGSPAGGNFLAASALLAAISGCSVLFYRAGPKAFEHPYASEERFREVLKYMPWDARTAGMQKGTGIKRLYGYARNPLAHAFGVSYHPGKASGEVPSELQWTLAIDKRRLSMRLIHQLEEAADLPSFVGPPLRRTHERTATQPERLVLSVGGLYWGLHRMLHNLFADPTEALSANDMARRFLEASVG